PENKDCLYFPNLKKPEDKKKASDEDLKKLAGQIKFSDSRRDSVRAVCKVLEVEAKVNTFWAFFPKGLEDELAKKEVGFNNRRPEDIEETVFRVKFSGAKYEIVVEDQTIKK